MIYLAKIANNCKDKKYEWKIARVDLDGNVEFE